jgi:hypothetical protein
MLIYYEQSPLEPMLMEATSESTCSKCRVSIGQQLVAPARTICDSQRMGWQPGEGGIGAEGPRHHPDTANQRPKASEQLAKLLHPQNRQRCWSGGLVFTPSV